jgi:hypothetical protein
MKSRVVKIQSPPDGGLGVKKGSNKESGGSITIRIINPLNPPNGGLELERDL